MKKVPFSNRLSATIKQLSLLTFISLAAVANLQAQVPYQLSNSKENTVKISGKSNVHDWTMIAQNPVCEASFGQLSPDGSPKSLTSVIFSVNAKSLKSEHQSMDNRTYKTIKADAFPQITFKLSEGNITSVQKGRFSIKTTGTLTIAGVSKVINMQVNGEVKADNSITCTGEERLKLTEFNIDPPSFMLGTMKVANELTISYTLNLKK